LLYECYDNDLVVTAAYATSGGATTETSIDITDVYFDMEATDNLHDTFEITLANSIDIPKGYELRFTIFPCKNPPSLRELITFGGYTTDSDGNRIEEWTDSKYKTTLPGKWLDTSTVVIADLGRDVDQYMVNEKD
jgi:hypothetical protein